MKSNGTRPALANERVQTNAAGQVVLKLKTAWRDGTKHLVHVAAGVHAAAGVAGDSPASRRLVVFALAAEWQL